MYMELGFINVSELLKKGFQNVFKLYELTTTIKSNL